MCIRDRVYIKGINKKVQQAIQSCDICQKVKCNNERKEGVMIPITSTGKLEKVFLDICGPFPRSGGRHKYKFIVIIFDHFSKYTKLYPITRATTKKIIEIIIERYIMEVGRPYSIITDHGTQFKGKLWKENLIEHGIKTYKTSVYHPNSNPAERVLREVGRLLRTYCHEEQKRWHEYLASTEDFLNLSYHNTIEESPYTVMFERPPPREIKEIISFPSEPEYQFEGTKFYNRVLEKTEQQRKKYIQSQPKAIKYKVGEKVLVRNRELPSTIPVSYTHLDVYKRQMLGRLTR